MIIASIDLMNGKAVQLRRGREKILERDDPIALAKDFDRFGEVAIIDLDAAMGSGDNVETVKTLLKVANCRVGGGIRSVEQAREWVSLGAKKIIIGSKAFENDQINRTFLLELAAAIGPERVMIAIDAEKGEIVTRGWKHRTGLPLAETAAVLSEFAGSFLFTCVENEGTMQGIDREAVRGLLAATDRPVTVAGGVATLQEVEELSKLGVDIQLGMALYTGKIDLADGFVAGLNWKEELLPTITRDEQGQVLMLAYSSAASLKKAFDSGSMTYFSRSRQALWTKGETSGNTQQLLRMRVDCDKDAILATVRQSNAACHTGRYSCFEEQHFTLETLYDVIRERFENAPENSYTAKLKSGGLLYEKILEEAREVVEARDRDDIIWEAADVLYFLTALLARNDIRLDEVLMELYRRRNK